VHFLAASYCNFSQVVFGFLKSLKSLDLSYNPFLQAPPLGNATNLALLSLDGVPSIGGEIRHCQFLGPPNVRLLTLSSCNISGALKKVMNCFGSSLQGVPPSLDLRSNMIDCTPEDSYFSFANVSF
jgi:hypothetical protein